MIKNILLCGVGGQGVLLAAKLIAFAAFNAGYKVFTNEIHGMAQRGGSVTASVRFGDDQVCAPLFPDGTADLLFAAEHVEAIRNAHVLKADGCAVIAKQSVIPVTVLTGGAKYPADVEDRIRALFPHFVYQDCESLAEQLGNPKLANTILLGIASRFLPEISGDAWEKAIRSLVKPELVEINLTAFAKGASL